MKLLLELKNLFSLFKVASKRCPGYDIPSEVLKFQPNIGFASSCLDNWFGPLLYQQSTTGYKVWYHTLSTKKAKQKWIPNWSFINIFLIMTWFDDSLSLWIVWSNHKIRNTLSFSRWKAGLMILLCCAHFSPSRVVSPLVRMRMSWFRGGPPKWPSLFESTSFINSGSWMINLGVVPNQHRETFPVSPNIKQFKDHVINWKKSGN